LEAQECGPQGGQGHTRGQGMTATRTAMSHVWGGEGGTAAGMDAFSSKQQQLPAEQSAGSNQPVWLGRYRSAGSAREGGNQSGADTREQLHACIPQNISTLATGYWVHRPACSMPWEFISFRSGPTVWSTCCHVPHAPGGALHFSECVCPGTPWFPVLVQGA